MSKKENTQQAIKVVVAKRGYDGNHQYKVTHTVNLLDHIVSSYVDLAVLKDLLTAGVRVTVSER